MDGTRLPQIGYEMLVMGKGTTLYINPAHVEHAEGTPTNKSQFMLPSSKTGGGGVVYQFFADSLRQRFPNPDDLLDFARGKLGESVSWLRSLTPEAFERVRATVLASYDTIGLPRQKYDKRPTPIPDAELVNIAAQYARHVTGERLSQPPRKVCAIDGMLALGKDVLRRGRLHEAIMGRMDEYRQFGNDASLHDLAQTKAIEIAHGFEGMMKDDPNFLL